MTAEVRQHGAEGIKQTADRDGEMGGAPPATQRRDASIDRWRRVQRGALSTAAHSRTCRTLVRRGATAELTPALRPGRPAPRRAWKRQWVNGRRPGPPANRTGYSYWSRTRQRQGAARHRFLLVPDGQQASVRPDLNLGCAAVLQKCFQRHAGALTAWSGPESTRVWGTWPGTAVSDLPRFLKAIHASAPAAGAWPAPGLWRPCSCASFARWYRSPSHISPVPAAWGKPGPEVSMLKIFRPNCSSTRKLGLGSPEEDSGPAALAGPGFLGGGDLHPVA